MKTLRYSGLLLFLGISGVSERDLFAQKAPSSEKVLLQSDSVVSNDSSSQTSIHINYWSLKGPEGIEQRRLLRQLCDSFLCEYIQDIRIPEAGEPMGVIRNDFEIRPETGFIDPWISSTLYTISVQYAGAVHPWTYYHAMNYDFIRKREVSFKTYFPLRTAEDSSELRKIIGKRLLGEDSLFEENQVFENGLLSGIFNIENGSIRFDYSDYVLGQGPSLVSTTIAKKDLLQFISEEYGGARQANSRNYYAEIKNYNLKSLWIGDSIYLDDATPSEPHWMKHPEPLGFIDTNYQRFYIHFSSITRNSYNPYEYFVNGKTRVNNSICIFKGIIKVKSADLGTFLEDSLFKTGTVSCEVVLYEDKKALASGVIRGKYDCGYLIDQNGKLRYDALTLVADGYCNNQFEGTWTSYKTGISKKCCWGDFRIPDSRKDFDWGTGEFSPNQKYRFNGWDTYIKQYENGSFTPEAKKAMEIEEQQWWK